MREIFSDHIARLQALYARALSRLEGVEGLIIHSGEEQLYYADDQAAPFKAFGHFSHWLPVARPEQAVLIRPGQRPVYLQVIPQDFWYEQSIDNANWWAGEFDIITLSSPSQFGEHLPSTRRLAFLGQNTRLADGLGIPQHHINPRALLHCLDYWRACKSQFEIEQIRAANRVALKGHSAAKTCFLEGGFEYEIHMAFLRACGITEQECPYTSIVALDAKAAILHYQNKRRRRNPDDQGRVCLIDAGHRVNNYCSDVTRTSIRPGTSALFEELLRRVTTINQVLVRMVKPGISFVDIHRSAMRQIAALAIDLELITCNLEQAIELNLAGLFMPHGVGHLLGLQVHDVGGHLASEDGSLRPPPEEYPFLRNTRTLAQDMVFTIEPGFYFIPLLLDSVRGTDRSGLLNWKLIDSLAPLGGIRIEDNIRVTASGFENLTRP